MPKRKTMATILRELNYRSPQQMEGFRHYRFERWVREQAIRLGWEPKPDSPEAHEEALQILLANTREKLAAGG